MYVIMVMPGMDGVSAIRAIRQPHGSGNSLVT